MIDHSVFLSFNVSVSFVEQVALVPETMCSNTDVGKLCYFSYIHSIFQSGKHNHYSLGENRKVSLIVFSEAL